MEKSNEKNIAAPHPRSKQFFIISIVVLITALGGSGYYAYKIKEKREAQRVEQERIAEEEAKKKAEEESTEALKKEVAEIDTSEIKAAVADLKAAMGTFK